MKEPQRKPRAIVSVAFSRDEFDLVMAEARRRNMKLSAYIRERVLRPAPPHSGVTITTSLDGIVRRQP